MKCVKRIAGNLCALVFFLLFSVCCNCANAQQKHNNFISTPFVNKVFVEERGQFTQRAAEGSVAFADKISFAVENGEFHSYFSPSGITFRFAEYKRIEEKEREEEDEEFEDEEERERERGREREEMEEQRYEREWHTVSLKFVNANPLAEIVAGDKAREYYNYACFNDSAQYNFVAAYKKIKYLNLYPGVDAEFELPEAGGIKYQFIVKPGAVIPEIAFELTGNESLSLDAVGNLLIKSAFGTLTDHAPTAYTAKSHKSIDVKYSLEGNRVRFQFKSAKTSSKEGIVIDPWITATTFPATNSAFDIQEDAAGNVFVHGSTSDYQVQKYDPNGVLVWTYVTHSTFLGDIAVDNPGNVYIIGGYAAGKRQKLNPAGVQQWQFAGLSEEWRLAFDYSKTVLTVGGYFVNPGGNNLGRFDTNTGAISDQIVYGAETRGIATDCNGDMYSLHVTFGYSGAAASNMLRKTNADFTPGIAVQSGFLLAEAEPAAGYAPNPLYSAPIYQGINGLVVNGAYVYIFDGASIRRFDKATLSFINSVAVPNGVRMMCSGIAADYCGYIYAGSQNGIVKFDSLLNYQQTIAAPGIVYDILLANTGALLVSGAGFLGNFDIACNPPGPLTATTNAGCGAGTVTATPAGGIGPYTYFWQPNGETTASVSSLSSGTYAYTVNDAFCHSYTGMATVNANPVATFNGNSTAINSNMGVNRACAADAVQFGDSSTSSSGNIVSWQWDFGDGSAVDVSQNPLHVYALAGTYAVTLTVTTDSGCSNTSTVPVDVYPLPVADFTNSLFCPGVQGSFTNQSVSTDPIATYNWNFGDGSPIDNLQNSVHSYTTSNSYNVNLSVTSSNGCGHDTTKVVQVNPNPEANFSAPGVCYPSASVFTNLSSVANPAAITAWTWDIGNDGSVDYTTTDITHAFAAAGNYNVLLGIVSTGGCVDDTLISITVFEGVTAGFSTANVCSDVAAVFTDQSISPGSIANWNWSFDDGTFDVAQSPSHKYAAASTYQVQLRVTTNQGCADSITKQLTIYPLPVVDFEAIPASGCLPLNVALNDLSNIASGNIVGWNWQLENGFSSTQQNTNYNFTSAGLYDVALTVTSDMGCVTNLTRSDFITVYSNPVAAFSASPQITELLYPEIKFKDLSTGGPVQWQWQFGTGDNSTGQNPIYSYGETGTYIVELEVTDINGCTDTVTHTVIIIPSSTIFIPNAFTPNGDGNNDTWGVIATNIKFFEVQVFDRIGEKVFESNDINKQWDGTYLDKPLAPAVFVYQCTFVNENNDTRNLKGSITLIK